MSVDKLLDAEAEKQAELDEIVERAQPTVQARIFELLTNVEGRNENMFGNAGADINLVIADFESIPVVSRDMGWQAAFSAVFVAARTQAYAELILPGIIEASEYSGQAIKKIADKMPKEELKEAAKQGIGKSRIKSATEKRRQITVSR